MKMPVLMCILMAAALGSCSTQKAESLTIAGQVFLCGEGMEGVCVSLEHPQYGTVETYTDALGMYRFEQAWTSQYTITPFIENCEIVPVQKLVDVDGHTVVSDFIVRPLWEKVYGSGHHEVVNDMAQTLRCGYVYAGNTDYSGSYGSFIVRVDALGRQLWYKEQSHNLYMSANGVAALADGSVVIAGCKAGAETSGNIRITKVDGNGDVMWERIYGGSQWDEAFGLVRIDSGSDKGFMLAGITESAGNGRADIFVMKLDDTGTIAGSLFDVLYGGQYQDGVTRIISLRNGGYIITGGMEYESLVRADSRIIKINSMRQHVWSKEYNIDAYDYATDAAELENGDIIVCGIAYEMQNKERIWAARLTGDGNTEKWRKEFVIGKSSGVYGMTLNADGTIVCTGYTVPEGEHKKDMLVFSIDDNGELLWMHRYGSGEGDHIGRRVLRAGDGGLAVAGTIMNGAVGVDAYCLKLNNEGQL